MLFLTNGVVTETMMKQRGFFFKKSNKTQIEVSEKAYVICQKMLNKIPARQGEYCGEYR